MEHSAKEIYEMHAIIKGNVQGVGFRATARYYASGLGVTGTVRNLPDGAVEIYAYGSKSRLEELMKKLKEEAFPEKIEDEAIEFFPVETPHETFKIIY